MARVTTAAALAAEAEWAKWTAQHKAGTGEPCPRCGALEVWPTRGGVACAECGWAGA